jgi:two-component system, OmpR family, phosphate regulon sensor histidine kinase PhoR
MNRHLIAAVVLLALACLTFIQYRLLVTGVKLEKQRFDQQAGAAVNTVADTINKPGIIGEALVARLKMTDMPRRSRDFLADTLDAMLSRELQRRGITARFTSVVTDKYDAQIVLASQHFKRENFTFGRYAVPLGHYIIGECHCEMVLHLDINNLFTYLLGELDYLVVPSVFCLLTILAGLLLLINTLRKEQKLNAVKNDFINNLTHELNTPAFSISISSKLAKENLEKGDTGKAAHFLQLIENENEKLKKHIEKVLELASLESDRYELKKEESDVHALMAEVIAGFGPQVESREGRLKMFLEAEKSVLAVDATHFKNVLQNLLDNALKYSPGKPEIEVKSADSGNQFLLSVADRGMGIAPEHRRQVFQKFYRVTDGNSHNVKGFGLGLSYVQQVVKAHGGKVELESEPGEGTTVTVILPV